MTKGAQNEKKGAGQTSPDTHAAAPEAAAQTAPDTETPSKYPHDIDLTGGKKATILRRATTEDLLRARRMASSLNHGVNIFDQHEYMPALVAICVKFGGKHILPEDIGKEIPALDMMLLEGYVLGGVA
ncbi:MAG TPA: hypothetical protein PLV42_06885 [bacterium]|nr:hypothetical protein [bacterium]